MHFRFVFSELLASAFLLFCASAQAQNPVIHNQFTADPTARVFDGKVYMYPSHDIISPVEPERKWFAMGDYHVFSSTDLVHWTDHGVILSQEDVPWGKPDGYKMWAPDCVYKDGKYYFFFPDGPREGSGYRIGVAVSSSPTGPFVAYDAPIDGVVGIDPCVLIDGNGAAYLYWSDSGVLMGARLKDNMTELDGEAVKVDSGFPAGFKEGPFVFFKDGHYYLTFPWVQDRTETLAYAMGDSPLGPFEFKGIFMEQYADECWTNHHSFVEYQGQWYLFYHHNDYSPQFDKNRSARIDRVIFNADGTIQPVTPTYRGVGISSAREPVHLDRYSAISPAGVWIDFLDPSNTFAGWYVGFKRPSVWVKYRDVDFGAVSPSSVVARVRSSSGGSLAIGLGNEASFVEVTVPSSSGWTEVRASLHQKVTGIQSITATLLSGSDVQIDWIKFE